MKVTPGDAMAMHVGLFKRALAIVGPKRHDYSGEDDPFANLRSSLHVGVEPWRGAMVRWLDKIARLRRLAESGGVGEVAEAIEDTAADALNYCAIALALIAEAMPEERGKALVEKLTTYARNAEWPR